MDKTKFQFSLRMLFIAMTVAAVVIAFVATHLRIVIGGLIAAMLLFDAAIPLIIDFVEAWPEFKKPRLAQKPQTEGPTDRLAGEQLQ